MRHIAMSIRGIRRTSLPTVTNDTAKRGGIMDHRGVAPIKRMAFDAVFTSGHTDMAADTAVCTADIAADDLP